MTMLCPSTSDLSAFAVGMIFDDRLLARIENHLESCRHCLDTLDALSTEQDQLTAALRSSKTDSALQSPDLRRATSVVMGLTHSTLRSATRNKSATLGMPRYSAIDIATDPAIATMLGEYRLLEIIGIGGMSRVYRAEHTRLRRAVAVKVLNDERVDHVEAVQRFEREQQAVGRLSHPNIVVASDAGQAGGKLFLVMELLDGLDLSILSKRCGPLAIADACELVRQAALGLDCAHRAGIVHRDVKPSNLMLAVNEATGETNRCEATTPKPSAAVVAPPDVSVKLLDLGLARLDRMHLSDTSMTSPDQMMGTIDYMAPEQCLDSRDADARSDVYSLGATLFKLLTGKAPMADERNDTTAKKIRSLLLEPPPSIANYRPEVPKALARLVDRSLHRNPDTRLQSPRQMADALQAFTRGNDLGRLLQRARAIGEDRDDGDTGMSSKCIAANRGVTGNTGVTADKAFAGNTTSRPAQSRPPRRGLVAIMPWLLFLLLPFLIFGIAGIIWLKVDGGYLRIEAEPGIDVTVNVLRDGQIVDSIEVAKMTDALWYRSGSFEIRLPAGTDDCLTITGNRFELSRGGREKVVTITRVKDAALAAAASREHAEPRSAEDTLAPAGHTLQTVGNPVDKAPQPAIVPFDAAEAERHQQAWAQHLGLEIEHRNGLAMRLRLIPPGEFLMGTSEHFRINVAHRMGAAAISETMPQHKVRLTRPFYLAVHEVTRKQFRTVMGMLPEFKAGALHVPPADQDSVPVTRVTWEQAVDFCNRLSEQEQRTPCYQHVDGRFTFTGAAGYRLPTEAEWEFACLAGAEHVLAFAAGDVNEFAWVDRNSAERPHPVGSLRANAFGIFDLHGNASEWCHDYFAADYYRRFADRVAVDPMGPERGAIHTVRGSSCGGMYQQALQRMPGPIGYNAGFRVVLNVPANRRAAVPAGQ